MFKAHIHTFPLVLYVSYVQAGDVLYESVADRLQCMLGPRMKPVDGGAVYQSRKLPSTRAKGEADRGETQHHLQHRRNVRI